MIRDRLLFEEYVLDLRENTLLDIAIAQEYMTESDKESVHKSICDKLVSMVSSLIKRIRDGINKMRSKISKKLNDASFKIKIAKIRNCKVDKEVEFVDVWKFEHVFKKEVREICHLCEEWTKNYDKSGASVSKANKFENKYKYIVNKYEAELEKIKKTKIKVSSLKLKKWLLQNTQPNGDPAGMLFIYTQRLEKCEATLKEVSEKKKEFIANTGYDNGPASFTKFITNSSIYIKRNSDWLSMIALSSIAVFTSMMLEHSDKKDIGKNYKPDHTEKEIQDRDKKVYQNTVYDDKDYHSKKKSAAKKARVAAGGLAVMSAYRKSKTSSKNSI